MTRIEAYRLKEDYAVEKKTEKAKVIELKRRGDNTCRGCQEKIDAEWTYCPFCFTTVENPVSMKEAKKTKQTEYRYVERECPSCKTKVNRHFTYCPTCWEVFK